MSEIILENVLREVQGEKQALYRQMKLLTLLIDQSVNQDKHPNNRLDAQHAAYWFSMSLKTSGEESVNYRVKAEKASSDVREYFKEFNPI
jgi:hypothetical protein|tara:strand:- start:466 stop:735 length:270 start_codon:yes stop_codon:yes gene_type:complete